jgi:hypothetical protein
MDAFSGIVIIAAIFLLALKLTIAEWRADKAEWERRG